MVVRNALVHHGCHYPQRRWRPADSGSRRRQSHHVHRNLQVPCLERAVGNQALSANTRNNRSVQIMKSPCLFAPMLSGSPVPAGISTRVFLNTASNTTTAISSNMMGIELLDTQVGRLATKSWT